MRRGEKETNNDDQKNQLHSSRVVFRMLYQSTLLLTSFQ